MSHGKRRERSPGGLRLTSVLREFFPFVIIVIGLENMFRLIKAVLATPAEQSTTVRISTALGEVGFLSFVAVATDLAILALISCISVPAVREFCIFAGVALLMDFVWHMTFFLAVLTADVRRLELQDSLDRLLSLSSQDDEDVDLSLSTPAEKTNKLMEYFFQGTSPLSTRIAGSAIVSFLTAQFPFSLDWLTTV
jgi:predicted RND superfamily exporter protein